METKIEQLNKQIKSNSEMHTERIESLQIANGKNISRLEAEKIEIQNSHNATTTKLEKDLDNHRLQNDTLKSQILQISAQMSESLGVKEEIIKSLGADIDQLNGNLVMMRTTSTEQSNEIQKLHANLLNKHEDIKRYNVEISQLNLQLEANCKLIESLNEDCKKLDNFYKDLSDQYQSLKCSYSEKCDSLLAETAQINEVRLDHAKELEALTITMNTKLSIQENDFMKHKVQLEQKIVNFKAENEHLSR